MATPTYLYTDLSTAVNEGISGKKSNLINERALYNRGIREVNSLIDVRTQKRKVQISPGIYTKVYSYAAPSDIKDTAVVDIQKQTNRKEEFFLTTPEEFDRTKTFRTGLIAFDDHDFIKLLNLSTELNTTEVAINEFDSLTANGTFVASGDASAMSIDAVNFINGNASLQFSSASSVNPAVITNSNMAAIDLTKFNSHELFLWVYIPSTTGLTNFILNWGSDASNYWTQTVTTTHEGLAFQIGWNLLRFNWPATSTGSPVITAVNYFQVTITKTGSMAAQTQWRLDFLVARYGEIHSIIYYSKYGWQNNTYSYIENSTADTDYLVADTDEFDLYVGYCTFLASKAVRMDANDRKSISDAWDKIQARYVQRFPSDRKLYQDTYYEFATIEGDFDVFRDRGGLFADETLH